MLTGMWVYRLHTGVQRGVHLSGTRWRAGCLRDCMTVEGQRCQACRGQAHGVGRRRAARCRLTGSTKVDARQQAPLGWVNTNAPGNQAGTH
jgi:hypothetical protein